MPSGGLFRRGWKNNKPKALTRGPMWWPGVAADSMSRLGDSKMDAALAGIVREFRARYARHDDGDVNPSRADIRENLRRLAEEIKDSDMLMAVRILDSATTMHLRGAKRAPLRHIAEPGAPLSLIGGPARIRALARMALVEMPADPGGKRAPHGIDLRLSRRLIEHWNARHRDKAAASKMPTPFLEFFRLAFLQAGRELGRESVRALVGKALRDLKK